MDLSLTILYYTANVIAEGFAQRVRDHHSGVIPPSVPVISISQKPITWGDTNLCVGDIGASTYNVYQQILRGAKLATTPYVACLEDDCLYVPSHFEFRPPDEETFCYSLNRWWVHPKTFRYRKRSGMHTCICSRELLIETLETRFARLSRPTDDPEARRSGWGEPGRYEGVTGCPKVKLQYFKTAQPLLTFDHRDSIGGRRKISDTDVLQPSLAPWGRADQLWSEIVDGR